MNEPEIKPPPPVETPDPEPLPAPPSEGDLALEAARRAELRGDREAAATLYARAARVSVEMGRRGEALYSLAMLHADPGESRDLGLARGDLQQLLEISPGHPRSREARTLLSLIEELTQAQQQSAALRGDVESAHAESIALKAEL